VAAAEAQRRSGPPFYHRALLTITIMMPIMSPTFFQYHLIRRYHNYSRLLQRGMRQLQRKVVKTVNQHCLVWISLDTF